MTDDEFWEALDGLYAYDMGATDSGVHDEALRERVKAELAKDLGPNQLYSDRVARLVRDHAFSDAGIAAGYGLEDVDQFIHWLDDYMR